VQFADSAPLGLVSVFAEAGEEFPRDIRGDVSHGEFCPEACAAAVEGDEEREAPTETRRKTNNRFMLVELMIFHPTSR
jgi:hypothetical protein